MEMLASSVEPRRLALVPSRSRQARQQLECRGLDGHGHQVVRVVELNLCPSGDPRDERVAREPHASCEGCEWSLQVLLAQADRQDAALRIPKPICVRLTRRLDHDVGRAAVMLLVLVGTRKAALQDDGDRGARMLVHLQMQSSGKAHGRDAPAWKVDRPDRCGAGGHRYLVSPHTTNSPTRPAAFK